ncbi:MAG: Holliday junction resolvase RuvX [Acidobacteriota bacterium]|nr:Holliday junction resolvase RuvX [Acidobacteriota bacterium]
MADDQAGSYPLLPPRIAAFDVGDRRIGVALTDPLGYTVQPLLTIYRTTLRADLKSIGRILRRHNVAEAVVGNPLHLSGEPSPRSALSQTFAEELRAAFHLPVHLCDERLTTQEAHGILDEAGHPRGADRRRIIDQVAAVLILESFLAERSRPRCVPGP